MKLESCKDYSILKGKLNKSQLSYINNVINNYIEYLYEYDDGNINTDIIGEYCNKYGNELIIDWYEGLITTDEFLEDFVRR